MVDKKEALKRVEKIIDKVNNRDFTIYFFVMDCKNVPNGKTSYAYNLAKTLSELKYKVCMLYQIEDEYTEEEIEKINSKGLIPDEKRYFVGVEKWLGKEYSSLPHINIQKPDAWSVGPEDILFIPEAFSGMMYDTYRYHLPCKRFVLLDNYDYVTEFIPTEKQWINYEIRDVVTTTEYNKDMITHVFPYLEGHTTVIPPFIPKCFKKPLKEPQLIVNVVTKHQEDFNKIMKNFYWLYPSMKFVTFRDIRGFSIQRLSELLQEGAITVWVDSETPFGFTALAAMRCNNILIGKIPEIIQDWMLDDKKDLMDNAIWVGNLYNIPEALFKVISSWMTDNIPSELYESMEKTNSMYTYEEFKENVKNFIESESKKRIEEFKYVMKLKEKEETNE